MNPRPPALRLVLFDIDGTLIATGGAGVRAFASVAHHTFGRPDGTRRLNFAGRTDRSIVREFFTNEGIPPTSENFERFFADYVFWLDHHLERLPGKLLPGVMEFLGALRALPDAPRIGLLTGNIRLGAELKLRRYGVWNEFEFGAFADDHEDRNVLAAIARDRGAALLGQPLDGSDVLVIGDTPLDIACAHAIGARCLAVATGGSRLETLNSHSPAWAVPDLTCWSVSRYFESASNAA